MCLHATRRSWRNIIDCFFLLHRLHWCYIDYRCCTIRSCNRRSKVEVMKQNKISALDFAHTWNMMLKCSIKNNKMCVTCWLRKIIQRDESNSDSRRRRLGFHYLFRFGWQSCTLAKRYFFGLNGGSEIWLYLLRRRQLLINHSLEQWYTLTISYANFSLVLIYPVVAELWEVESLLRYFWLTYSQVVN